jgi:hypothetical protein
LERNEDEALYSISKEFGLLLEQFEKFMRKRRKRQAVLENARNNFFEGKENKSTEDERQFVFCFNSCFDRAFELELELEILKTEESP